MYPQATETIVYPTNSEMLGVGFRFQHRLQGRKMPPMLPMIVKPSIEYRLLHGWQVHDYFMKDGDFYVTWVYGNVPYASVDIADEPVTFREIKRAKGIDIGD